MDKLQKIKRLTPAQIEAYLKRIEYDGDRRVCKSTLDDLIWHHQLHVPFETLDCHDMNKEISLDPDAIFDKIVNQRRGGHCIETNSCFCRLLNSLGFDARPCLARVLFGNEEFTHPFDHRPTLITLEGHTYFCDIGIGGPMPSGALDINLSGWQDLRADCYAVKPAQTQGWYELIRQTSHGTQSPENSNTDGYERSVNSSDSKKAAGYKAPEKNVDSDSSVTIAVANIDMIFSTIHTYETDFIFLNYYMTHHPEALHKSTRIVNQRTPEGFNMIWNDEYREFKNGKLILKQAIDGNLAEILREKFEIAISLDDV